MKNTVLFAEKYKRSCWNLFGVFIITINNDEFLIQDSLDGCATNN